jgi:hypothetical protein
LSCFRSELSTFLQLLCAQIADNIRKYNFKTV